MSSGKSNNNNDQQSNNDQQTNDQQGQATDQQQQPMQVAAANTTYVPMPAGGLQALAEQLYPDDRDNRDKMTGHVRDLWLLNTDTLRDDTSYQAGQHVRIPA